MTISFKSIFFFVFISLMCILNVKAQNEKENRIDTIQSVDKTISIGDISLESEKLSLRIKKLRKILIPSITVNEVDSILKRVESEIQNKKDSLLPLLPTMSHRLLKVLKVEWNDYRAQLKDYQTVLVNRSKEINSITDELSDEVIRWELTRKELFKNSSSTDVNEGLNKIISTIQEILIVAHKRLDDVFTTQKGFMGLVLDVDEFIEEIEMTKLQIQKDYFSFDSKPIWESSKIGFLTTIDSTKVKKTNLTNQILSKIGENKNQLLEFLNQNIKTLIFQIFFLLVLFFAILKANSHWKDDKKLKNPLGKQTKTILSHPISATLVVGILISAFFYNHFVPSFTELLIILILTGTVYLLPKITNKRFSLPLALILFAYLLQIVEAYLQPESSLVRILIIINAVILIVALRIGKKIMIEYSNQSNKTYSFFNFLSTVYILILLSAIFANMIGMVNLSSFLVYGVLISIALGLVVYLAILIITSIIILFFKFRKLHNIQAISSLVNMTNKRIKPILGFVGVLVWIMFTLKGFELYNILVNWFNELMTIHWEIGEMTISLGGILSFLGIFILTLFLAKMAATIFQDEWMVRILPRGVAPAISLLLRILLIAVGFYMALSAAGLDLSKLGFMVGALGVGIGFGLQNVVLNFVAGLILAFERPINLGDTIEVDQEFGIVTNIGVRSSNIKSYSGYEAIIPNGDLISKKVINYTLTNKDRRSKIVMKTAASADPEKMILLFNEIAADNPNVKSNPLPKTYFYGYDVDGNLSFALLYWTTFSDTLKTDSEIALKIFSKLKKEGIHPPVPVRRIIK